MKTTELIATLVLPKLPKVGCRTARKLIRHFGSAEAVFQRIGRENTKLFNSVAAVFKRPEAKHIWDAAEKEVARIEEHDISWVAHSDPGFAYGTDITAQLAAVENNLITYGCLGHGILNCYPNKHLKHRKKIEAQGGFLTELWSHEQIQRAHFLQRNRIIAGLAQATIVVESKSKGGALTTAAYALGYERDVFAVPGRPNDAVAQGCLELIKTQKATCITSGEDVAKLLGWKKEKATAPQRQLFVSLNDKEQQVVKHMSATPKHIDLIALDASLKVSELSSLLFQLEMKGVVMAQAGKLFKLL